MIPARKRRLFRAWFGRQIEGRLRRTFGALEIHGLPRLEAALAEGPVVVVSNHSAWWDALVILQLVDRILHADGHALMDAKNLRERPFFAKVGAFGVDLDDPRDGARAIRYAAGLLDGPGRLVWVFPQGRERPESARPLGFQPGAAAIARLAKGCQVVPVGLRYVFGEAEHPEIQLAVGEPLAPEREVDAGRRRQEEEVEALLGALERYLDGGPAPAPETRRTLERRPDRLGALAERMLAWMTPL
ncbi:MAG: lysophospholipid acyltransferase family protein [Deltaproteobacteria bacterium]|nr:lysophospholipid acyltransferase family protein [Deltaproteobacteria bacterium]